MEGGQEKAAAKDGDDKAEAAEPDLTGLESEAEPITPGGTAGSTREEASLGASDYSGAEWRGAED